MVLLEAEDPLGDSVGGGTRARHAWVRPGAGVAATLFALAPTSASAQEGMKIEDRITCPGCAIETGPSITLAPPDDHVYFTSLPPPIVARDSEGNYVVTRVIGDALVAVFDAEGRFISSYGRIGEGPGEFASTPMAMAIGENDVVHLIDPLTLHTLAPRAERSLAQVRLPVFAFAAVVLRSGIALQAPLRTEAGNTTVQILRSDGTIRSSIGVTEVGDGRSQPEPISENLDLRRALGRSNDHADVWAAPVHRYEVIRYGPDGDEKTRLERVSERFPPDSEARWGLGGIIHQDAEGLLWITIGREASSSSPMTDERPPGAEGPAVDPFVDLNQVMDITVEVLDPVMGELVARRDFDEVVQFVATPGDDVFIYSLHPDALGNLECVVRPLTLRRE